MLVIWTATITHSSTTDTHEITEATAWRCLEASERTSASLAWKPCSSLRVTRRAAQVMNREASTAPISSRTIRKPLVMTHSPISPRHRACQRCPGEKAKTMRSVAIRGVAPPDPGFEESVDVAVEHRGRVADFVLGTQVLDHLIRVQHIGAHLVAP